MPYPSKLALLFTLAALTVGSITTAAAVAQPPPEETAMSSEIQLVEDFITACNARDIDRVMQFFTEDAVYHNIPMEPAQGTGAVRALIASYMESATEVDWEIVAISQAGSVVLTERIDRFAFGDKKVVLPVMGAFEVRDGKIAAWRDYFDLATWTRQMGGEG